MFVVYPCGSYIMSNIIGHIIIEIIHGTSMQDNIVARMVKNHGILLRVLLLIQMLFSSMTNAFHHLFVGLCGQIFCSLVALQHRPIVFHDRAIKASWFRSYHLSSVGGGLYRHFQNLILSLLCLVYRNYGVFLLGKTSLFLNVVDV